MDIFQEQKLSTENQLNTLKSKTTVLSLTSLVTFILIFVFLFLANSFYEIISILSLISLLIFIVVTLKFNEHELVVKGLKNKLVVIKNYEYRISNQFHTFSNNGSRYLEEENFYLSDLDIFGDSSLFQMINVCETKMGQDILADRLKSKTDKYISDVHAVEELKDKKSLSIDFQANTYGYSKDLSKVSLEYSLEELKQIPKINVLLEVLLPLILILLTVASIVISVITGGIQYLIADLILNFCVAFMYNILKKNSFTSIKNIVSSLSPLSRNFKLISEEEFISKQLNSIKNDIVLGNEAMINLQKIETLVSLQDNFLSNIIVNLFVPFNIIVYLNYVKFHKKSNINIDKSINTYTNLESLLSLAIIPQIKEVVCIPTLNTNLNITFEEIKHPLIKEQACVENSLSINPSVNIITGSNMSGKTSFLRTIGINLVLMYAGGMVNANKFDSDIVNIYSSMRITDDIKNGISTFYRELLRIKNAIKDATSGVKSIILVDEVFRGTNSNDRILGAISLINHLKLDNVILFMTTHDFELCKVEGVNNYHFEEHYQDDKIGFDYKLKNGQCTTTNAVYLMKLAGIIQ